MDNLPHETKKKGFLKMENKTICPLFLAVDQSSYGIQCKKDNCGWFDKDADKCALLSIAHNLKGIDNQLGDISYGIQ